MISLVAEFDAATDTDKKKVATLVVDFYAEVKEGSPRDTGEFNDAWEMIQESEIEWTIKNTQDDYNWVLWRGRRFVNGRWYGSTQGWGQDGGDVIFQKFKERLQEPV